MQNPKKEIKQLYEQLWDILEDYEEIIRFKYETYVVEEGAIGILVIETQKGSDCYNYYPGRKSFQLTHSMPFYNPKEQIKATKNAINQLFNKED